MIEGMRNSPAQSPESKALMATVYQRAKDADATVILVGAEDERVREAAATIEKMDVAKLRLLDNASFGQLSEEEKDTLAEVVHDAFAQARKEEDRISTDEARRRLESDPKYLAAAMVKAGMADGFVAGSDSETADVIRPAVRIIGTPNGYASSFFIMLPPEGTPRFFADCGFNIDPNSEQLAKIAVDTANNVRALGIEPRVAFISFSTGADLHHEHIKKLRQAIAYTKEMAPELKVGKHEMQLDAAIAPDVAKRKVEGDDEVAGQANVFIFPDLNAGNIAYKAVERFGNVRAVGPIFQGMSAPVNDLSRGCKASDIVDVVAVTAMQAGALKQKH